jgi:anion-transporting  ArsA/GET3 family ATPase
MTEDFRERAAQVETMLRASTTAFVIVTSAARDSIDEAIWFRRTLADSGLPFAGVVVNRVHHDLLGDRDYEDVAAAVQAELGPELADRVAENFHDYHVLARRDTRNIARFATQLEGQPLLLVPHFDQDVHDIDGLVAVQRYLFADAAERERMIADVVA